MACLWLMNSADNDDSLPQKAMDAENRLAVMDEAVTGEARTGVVSFYYSPEAGETEDSLLPFRGCCGSWAEGEKTVSRHLRHAKLTPGVSLKVNKIYIDICNRDSCCTIYLFLSKLS